MRVVSAEVVGGEMFSGTRKNIKIGKMGQWNEPDHVKGSILRDTFFRPSQNFVPPKNVTLRSIVSSTWAF
jgi:hypothetical protein